MSPPFAPLAEHIIDALLESNPGLAATVGDHRFDGRLRDLSAGSVAADAAMLREASAALSQVDTDDLGPQDAVDHACLLAVVERELFELTEVREHEWNPIEHNPGRLLYELVSRESAPPEQRLTAAAARLDAVPDALATARAVLTDCPRIHLQTAVGQFAGAASLVREELPALVAQVPALAGSIEPLRAGALDALDGFVAWLRDRVAALGPAAGEDAAAEEPGARSPRLGRRLWEARLWHTLDTELSAARVLELARANVERVTAELRAAVDELPAGGPGRGGAGADRVRSAFDALSREHPDDASVVALAAALLAEATDFVAGHHLVTLLDDACVVKEMPEFDRGVAVAYCDSPGPLETADLPTFYCIAPTPAGWPPDRVESYYREYNNHAMRNLTVHEAMPGHFLQLAHSRRFRGSTRARALTHSGPFIEGWAVYAEEVMARHGFGGLPTRLQQLKMQLRSSINAILDQLVHCAELSRADAMALMTGEGYQEEGEAAGKWRRALLTSTQLSTYFVGYTEVRAIADARPAGTDPRAWRDAMLAHGSPPPRHLRTLLGV